MNPLHEAARELLTFLDESGWKACLIGGLVVQRWGEPRLTHDVDVAVLTAYGEEVPVINALLGTFRSRRDDARDFALANRVLLLRASNGVDLDVSLAAFDFEREVLDRATTFEFEPGLHLRTCSADDLIVYKLVAGRPRDLGDVESTVLRQATGLDADRVRRWIAIFAELKEDPDLGRPFEEALRRVARR
ncbi:MAG: hypothetical protein FJW23_05200 [Acidimicrobiia bacterium]|nr:hypothetical protein [Acidimicrobiia bacterium]